MEYAAAESHQYASNSRRPSDTYSTSSAATSASHRTLDNGQLDFQQAMSDFGSMFPSLSASVIEGVLRSNNGSVDSTIDKLLQISSSASVDSGPSRAKLTQRPLPKIPIVSKWKPALLAPLPHDFLRYIVFKCLRQSYLPMHCSYCRSSGLIFYFQNCGVRTCATSVEAANECELSAADQQL